MSLPKFTSEQMNVFRIKEGRYLLYLDILGFSDLVKTQSPENIYTKIDTMLNEFSEWTKINKQFDVIYFSDTVIFYQKSQGWGSWAFSDVYPLSAMVWTALAAGGIPTRGAISFGEFNVQSDSSGRHNVFFGSGLIEAHNTESAPNNSNWVGLTLCPSAWRAVAYADEGRIEELVQSKQLIVVGEDLRLNPFLHTGNLFTGAYYDEQIGEIQGDIRDWFAPHLRNEILALDFIRNQKNNADLTPKVQQKYVETWEMYQQMIEPEVLTWSLGLVDHMKAAPHSRTCEG